MEYWTIKWATSYYREKEARNQRKKKEAEAVIDYISNLGEIPLDASWSLTIYENNQNRLEQYIALTKVPLTPFLEDGLSLKKRFSNIGFLITLMGLPLNYSEPIHYGIDKFDKNFRSNNAQIAPKAGKVMEGNAPTHVVGDRNGGKH